MEKNNKKKEKNIYKISTYVLAAILVIATLLFIVNYYNQKAFNDGILVGQQSTMNTLISEVNTKGYVEIIKDGENESLALVPSQLIKKAQEDLISEILKNVEEKGYVGIYKEEEELILVPYIAPEQQEVPEEVIVE